MPRRTFLTALSVLSAALVTGCGFKLRGSQALPFATIYVGADPNSQFGAALRRHIAASGTTTTVEDADAADARLEVLRTSRTRDILSLSGEGKVREYQLNQSIVFRVLDRSGLELLPATSIAARREYNFDDSQVIAKEQEEALLWRDMESDMLQQLMRRIAAIGP